MTDLLSDDTDFEISKYYEARDILDAGVNPAIEKSKKSVFNPETRRNDVLLPMSSGGYVKIGEDDPEVMAEAPAQPAMPSASDVAPAQAAAEYAQQLQEMQGSYTLDDLRAAGYTDEQISTAGLDVQPTMPERRTEALSEQEVADIIASGQPIITADPTLRQEGSRIVSTYFFDLAVQGLREDLAEQGMGADEIERTVKAREGELLRNAEVYSNALFGTGATGYEVGLGDFATAGIMDIQEGYRMFQQQSGEGGTVGGRAIGMAIMAAGIAEATGVGYAFGKLLKRGAKALEPTLVRMGEEAQGRIDAEGATLFSNPVGPISDRVLAMTAKLLQPPEKEKIAANLPTPEIATEAEAQIAVQKNNYPSDAGWLQEGMEVANVKQKKDGKIEVTYKEVPYNFHIPPEGIDPAQWEQTIAEKTIEEIKSLAARAAAGDPAAKAIINEANWYRSMRARMRQEFGGLGDVFADLLGTTSAQTGVTQNWDNAIEIMRRFTRGEFDQEIAMYEEMLAKGEANPVKLGQLHKDPNNPFKLITKASGQLFNANSPSSTRALLDMFRTAKGSPKTPNFTGNLIGYTNAATVDVWAARFLRRMSGQKRLPPPVEKGVAGQHLAGSTLQDPKVGSEFGFGQRVIQAAADEINKQGIIKSVEPSIGDMGADDLQAVLWFLEKEIWTKKGWTSKAGEGGSLDFEASLAGAADQPRVKQLREKLNKKFTPPKPLKQKAGETDEEYATRMQEREDQARQADELAKQEAQEELDGSFAPLARYVLGISVERPNQRPTNVAQAETAERLGQPAKDDPSVVMYQVNNTYGRFMQEDERAFNAEFVVRENFDPTGVKTRMVEVAKDADQDAAFISKIVPERTPDTRPGVEIYFRTRQSADFARDLSDKLTEYGVDGFTFVTDARVQDMPGRQALQNEEAVAGITGLRFQYIPEFDVGADAWKAMTPEEKAAKIDEIEDMFDDIVIDIQKENSDIATAIVTHNETEVIERGDYDTVLGKTAE
jgi:hypothetical protein